MRPVAFAGLAGDRQRGGKALSRLSCALIIDPCTNRSPATAPDDRDAKLHRVRTVLDERDAESIRLTSVESLSWLLDGARVHVASNGPAVLAAEITRTDERIVCASNESERLLIEQLPTGLDVDEVPWHDSLADALDEPDGERHLDEPDVARELRAARASLLPGELDRYRRLCAGAAVALTDALANATPMQTETALAAAVTGRIAALGAEPLVVLVAGEARQFHRHPLPTDAQLGSTVMVVICARRHGMIANLTRWRCFTTAAYRSRRPVAAGLLEVEADVLDATRPGVALSTAFEVVRRSYSAHGFAADEWARHHQGGPTGYVGRDPRATPRTHDRVVAGQAFAWNPSAPSGKVEDTVLTTSEPARPIEVLTVDTRWPTVTVDGLARPDLLHD